VSRACLVGCFNALGAAEALSSLRSQEDEPAPAEAEVGYIGPMFEVLVFVYENYWRGDACPQLEQLGRKLTAHGFAPDEIRDALQWLDGLTLATQGIQLTRNADDDASVTVAPRGVGETAFVQAADSMRVYSMIEQNHLGAECLGFISFLETANVLTAGLREIVVERAMAAPGNPVALDALKIIVLMVHWSTGIEPDALVLDELSDAREERIAH
jgi:Smg protein